MITTETTVDTTLNDAFSRHADSVAQPRPGEWTLELRGAGLTVDATREDEWLSMRAQLPPSKKKAKGRPADPESHWDYLVGNKHLHGGARYIIDASGMHSLRVDLSLSTEETSSLQSRVAEAINGLQTFRSAATEDDTVPKHRQKDFCETYVDLPALMSEAGWPLEERETGHHVSPLENQHSFYQADLTLGAAGRTYVQVELLSTNKLTPKCKEALAIFLLTASRHIVMARPFAIESENRISVGFDVFFDSEPTSEELGHALSALSIATQTTGEESVMLLEEELAELYLAAGDWPRTREH